MEENMKKDCTYIWLDDSWNSLDCKGDQTSHSQRKSAGLFRRRTHAEAQYLYIHWCEDQNSLEKTQPWVWEDWGQGEQRMEMVTMATTQWTQMNWLWEIVKDRGISACFSLDFIKSLTHLSDSAITDLAVQQKNTTQQIARQLCLKN